MNDIRDVIIVVLSELCMFFMRVILDKPIDQAQETAPTNDTSDTVPTVSLGVRDTLTTTDVHEDQEFTSSIQVEMPVQPAKMELKTMLDTLFDEVCFGLSLSRFFDDHETLSFFVIYTHENPAPGKADSRMVRKLIEYLGKIGSKCRSDRGPTLRSDYLGSKARDDILENQFCLLPEDVSDSSVDKILLFYSEALKDYCAVPEGRKYMKTLKTVGLHGRKELQRNVHDESIMSSATAQSVKASIRAVVETHTEESWFHHVLTEIGLVHLRTTWDNDPYTVIPIDLHGTGKISKNLEFFTSTQHYLKPPPLGSVIIDQIEQCHRLFFLLLERIYEDLPIIVKLIQERYQIGFSYLNQGPSVSQDDFKMIVRKEVTEEIKRVGVYVPRRISRLQRSREAKAADAKRLRKEENTALKLKLELTAEREAAKRKKLEEDAAAERARVIDEHERKLAADAKAAADAEAAFKLKLELQACEEQERERKAYDDFLRKQREIEEIEEKAYRDALRRQRIKGEAGKKEYQAFLREQKEKQEAEEKAKKEHQAFLREQKEKQEAEENAKREEQARSDSAMRARLEIENEMYQAPPHFLPQAMRETLVWLTLHTTYQEWLLRDNGLLGLRGSPGSGKSIALSHLLQEAHREERNTHTVLSFSFQNQEDFRWDSRKRMYGTLLDNLIARQSKLKTEFWELTNDDWKIHSSADDFRGLFLDVVTKALEEGPIRIFLDSLDEAGDTEAREVIADLRYITRTLEGVATGLSICFTCRSYPSITVDNGLEIRLEQNNRNGIKHYVRSGVRDYIRDAQASNEFLETISATIANNSMGNFLYAVKMTSHVIDLLARFGPDSNIIIREVNETPEILMSIYRRILDQNIRNRPDGLTIAMTLIQLIQFSQRQISVEELRCFLVSDKSFMSMNRKSALDASEVLLEDEVAMTGLLKSYLADLVEIVDITDQSGTTKSVVKFASDSVAEWIWRSDEMASVFHTPDVDWRGLGHDRVARVCYYFIRTHRKDWNNLHTQALKANLDYATTYWFDHAAVAEAGGVSQAYLKDLLSGKEGKLTPKSKTYSSRDSHVVTHRSTNLPFNCLCMAERTGCPVFS
ncbi:hypothetical protein KCU92_g10149, partial [Aureobasidium melanogenum]